MGVTLKDIAECAGVTSATVSMVINNKPNISEATRKKVMKIAKELTIIPMSSRGGWPRGNPIPSASSCLTWRRVLS